MGETSLKRHGQDRTLKDDDFTTFPVYNAKLPQTANGGLVQIDKHVI